MLAIVPFKGGDRAKQRLGARLSTEERGALAQEMLEIVLQACRESRSIERIIVVTPDSRHISRDIEIVIDRGDGHAAAIEMALDLLSVNEDVFIVMSDCPGANHVAIDAVAEAAQPVAYVPARDGGVNALAWRGPRRWPLPFGGAEARSRMRSALEAAGIETAVLADSPLAFDLDRPGETGGTRNR